MIAPLFLALGLIAEPAVAAPQSTGTAQVFRDVCVSSALRRDAFEQAARQHRFRSARVTSASNEGGWNLVFRGEGVLVVLSRVAEHAGADTDTAQGSVCSVSVDRAEAGLTGDIETLASELGLQPEANVEITGSVPVRMWSKPGSLTLSYAAAPDSRAMITLSRQTVMIDPQISPPGN